MKTASTLLFAGAAVAYEYAAPSSSTPVGYTTITPGGSSYGPVTVTSQYQTVPTYVSSASSYSDFVYVSTVITDADGKKCTVTKTEEPVTVYHSKSTLTHTTTYAPAPSGAGYYPYNKNGTASEYTPHTKTWEELCEKIVEVPYKKLGPSALPGYPGSGLCGKECYSGEHHDSENDEDETSYQPAHVKEYKDGKWSTYTVTYTYGAPTPKATTYKTPGTYTVPEYDVTIHKTKTVAEEGTYTAPAGKTVTYGGEYTDVTKPTHITAAYAAYETEETKTKTVIKTTTIYADKPGHYTIAKPTVTSYEKEHVCHYPTAKVYPPGVYHHDKETVTITKTNEAYTCSYQKTSTYPTPTTTPAYPTATKDAYPTEYPTEYPTPSTTTPYGPDPSADYEEPAEAYGVPSAGYVKRGGMLERRKAEEKKAAPIGKRVILV
ncbi:hypothetical protein K458DRAFT_420455 [Lentithecium fluviatile CBS 122367]|uniref:Uncharacterized protein n=1 Tax=Lentithecium fluviatile CBS 122367 TaxID=1168545 RepID=A0A6G1ITW5_9PLEO|nr:hypothetical protein K458DRAFT_420455 [Lentithecium fluviatile CBS 122367]